MKKSIFTFVASALLFGCAGAPLPKQDREVTYVEKTNLSKKDAFNQALIYFGKTLGDSNVAIKVRDAETGTIVTRIAVECNELRAFMDPNRHMAVFSLEFNAKDKRARFVFEAVEQDVYNPLTGRLMSVNVVSSKSVADSMKACAARIKTAALQDFSGPTPAASKDW